MSNLLESLLTPEQRQAADLADQAAGYRPVAGTALQAWHWPQVIEAATIYRDKPTSKRAYRTPEEVKQYRAGYAEGVRYERDNQCDDTAVETPAYVDGFRDGRKDEEERADFEAACQESADELACEKERAAEADLIRGLPGRL